MKKLFMFIWETVCNRSYGSGSVTVIATDVDSAREILIEDDRLSERDMEIIMEVNPFKQEIVSGIVIYQYGSD